MNLKLFSSKIYVIVFSFFFLISCSSQKYYLFVGTYTDTYSKGIYVYDFDSQTGDAILVSNTDSVTNPSYLTISQDHKYVYAVNETNGLNQGRVTAYSFDKNNGKLHFLNTTFTGGDDPCYISTTSDNKWLAVANYSSGSTAMFPINNDGTVKPYTQLISDSVYRNPGESLSAHVHETVFSPDEKYMLTPDLGLDKVMIYHFDPSKDKPLLLSSPSSVESEKGSGPRHIVFHPNKKFVYLMHEMGGNVSVYHYDNGKSLQVQDLPTFPAGFTGKKDGAEIDISPDGRFLYTSNRGDLNSITIFSIDQADGKLTLRGYQSSLGSGPRNFIIDPTGNFLLVANQASESVIIFKRDRETGMLTKTGKEIHVPRPVCLQMILKNK